MGLIPEKTPSGVDQDKVTNPFFFFFAILPFSLISWDTTHRS